MPAREANAPVLHSFEDPTQLVQSLASYIIKAQTEAIDKKHKFSIAISGGSLPKQLAGLVDHPAAKWDKWCAHNFTNCRLAACTRTDRCIYIT